MAKLVLLHLSGKLLALVALYLLDFGDGPDGYDLSQSIGHYE